MPAVTVEDITVLPRIPLPDPATARQRPVRSISTAPRGFEGEGFPVYRAFAGALLLAFGVLVLGIGLIRRPGNRTEEVL